MERLKALAAETAPFGVRWRRHLHQHPELSFQEKETSAFVFTRLREMGYQPQRCGTGYGVKAVLQGARPGRTIALRADMDALPIHEETGLPYASTVPGVMHACGHDFHTATLLATAKALKQMQAELAGNVVLIFQPAEETLPGGAIDMIRAGVLDDPHVDAVFGLHVDAKTPAGQLGFTMGASYAAADMFDLTILGRGGHGAAPHHTIDSVLVGAQVVNALQHIHSRQISPYDQLVISIGHFKAGSKHNIIANEALLQGTVRTMSPELHSQVPGMIEKIVAGVCAAYGATYKLDYERGYPVLVNDGPMTEFARAAGAEVVGMENALVREPAMYGEDFAYFLQHRPGSFASVGVAGPLSAADPFPEHHPRHVVNDELAMPIAVEYFLSLCRAWSKKSGN